jgi:hypothetical protein
VTSSVQKDAVQEDYSKSAEVESGSPVQIPEGAEYVELGSRVHAFRGAETEDESRELRGFIRGALKEVFADFYVVKDAPVPIGVDPNGQVRAKTR